MNRVYKRIESVALLSGGLYLVFAFLTDLINFIASPSISWPVVGIVFASLVFGGIYLVSSPPIRVKLQFLGGIVKVLTFLGIGVTIAYITVNAVMFSTRIHITDPPVLLPVGLSILSLMFLLLAIRDGRDLIRQKGIR